MKWVPWDHILKTGHAEIDADHREMVKLFNELADAAMHQKGKITCCSVLDKIIEYTISHFKHEAKLMAKYRYPKAEQHNAEHTLLIRQALKYRTKFETGTSGSYIEPVHFPEDWLTRHIVTSDKELAAFLVNADAAR